VGGAVAVAIGVVAVVALTRSAADQPSWSIVTSANLNAQANNVVLGSACANADECWAVGAAFSNGGGAVPLIQEWNGSSWNLVAASGRSDALLAVTCVSSSECWAVGSVLSGPDNNPATPFVEEWNGEAWSTVPTPTLPGVAGAIFEGVSCPTASDCWAVGFTTDPTSRALASLVENWNGTTWSVVAGPSTGQPYSQLDGVTCLGPSNCWSVGSDGANQQNPQFLPIYPAAPGNQGLIEHWNGSAWSVVGSVSQPSPDGGYLTSVTCVTGTDCWASGTVTGSSGGADTALMEHWNGSMWTSVPAANPPGQSENTLSGVTCLDSSSCWAVGASNTFKGGGSELQPLAFIESWNGQSWSIQSSPNVAASSLLGSVACVRGVSCWSVGGALTLPTPSNGVFQTLIEQFVLPSGSSQGLSMTAADGGIFAFGDAAFHGSMGGQHLNQPIVGMAATPDGGGYWEVAADGGIFSFGDAAFHGSMGGQHLNQPIVGMAATPDGGGYWEVAADGGIFSFGDAAFYGSTGSLHLVRPISGMATTPNGGGYWLVGSDGGVFAFGNARYAGSIPGSGVTSTARIVSISATPSGQGYWLVGSNGSLSSYGDAAALGSLGGVQLVAPIVGAAAP
jgi:hypothetical protein